MTPAARLAAAAELLDRIAGGAAAEQVLTTWGRRARYAGSRDRAAVRDLVFDVLRRRRSCAAWGGGTSGRRLMLGLLREEGEAPEAWFTGDRYALAPLSAEEAAAGAAPRGLETLDVPDWIAPRLEASLGPQFEPVCRAFRRRAEVFLRWHAGRTSAEAACACLAGDGITAVPHALAPTALRVTEGARRIRQSAAFAEGLVELQDAGAQAVCAALPVDGATRVLDFCAGGGGKALALAARGAKVAAHDAEPARMSDLRARASRARTPVAVVPSGGLDREAPFDLVVADVPCSGSGAWRRQVEAKWRLDAGGLERLQQTQDDVLTAAAARVRHGGLLAYVTCSLLEEENEARIARFRDRARREWTVVLQRRISPLSGGDGFFLALMREAAG